MVAGCLIMLFGLTFSNNGESLQCAFDTAGLKLYARATSGGVFGEWKFICGADGADGEGGSGGGTSGSTVDKAETANKAYKLAAPITIQFTGDVTGEATFDGSANVISELKLRDGAGGGGGGAAQGVGGTIVVMATPTIAVPAGGVWFVCPAQDGCGISTKSNGFAAYMENVAGGSTLYQTQRVYNSDSGRDEISTVRGPVLCVRTA